MTSSSKRSQRQGLKGRVSVSGAALDFGGTEELEIWVATKGFDNDDAGVVYAELLDCNVTTWSCIELGSAERKKALILAISKK